ncbi:DUF1641 domain-containing protein [Caldalkalibacillus salinus]|uniref:DUF1641 domain-containing protein n=1 Tax=Caldalkalibacillus salinus TaxID=2803787 RepID=UPI0019229373|nr:DUF1641 domain-containing protein [Caldalkalibacillus salinus]
MAKAISHIEKHEPTPAERQAMALDELLSLIAHNKEAITTTLDILKELQEAGVLDILKGMLRTRDKIGVIGVEQLNQPHMHRTIKNGINLFQLIGEIDPDQLNTILGAANKGMTHINTSPDKVSKWQLIKSMNDPDVLSALSAMTGLLKGMGVELKKQQQSQNPH